MLTNRERFCLKHPLQKGNSRAYPVHEWCAGRLRSEQVRRKSYQRNWACRRVQCEAAHFQVSRRERASYLGAGGKAPGQLGESSWNAIPTLSSRPGMAG